MKVHYIKVAESNGDVYFTLRTRQSLKKVGRTPARGSQGYPRKVPFGKINLDKVDIGSMP